MVQATQFPALALETAGGEGTTEAAGAATLYARMEEQATVRTAIASSFMRNVAVHDHHRVALGRRTQRGRERYGLLCWHFHADFAAMHARKS
eukprot:6173898-Pleurochrysis_carterae.AAC.5